MKKYCQANAKSTGNQCRKRVVPGSKYCIMHIEYLPLIYGAIFGLALTELFRVFFPSQEVKLVDSLRKEVIVYQGVIEKNGRETKIRDQDNKAKLDSLNSWLKPFEKIAKDKYPMYGTERALNSLRLDMANIRELATPPSITFKNMITKRSGNILTTQFFFGKSKQGVLENLNFEIKILSPNSSKILNISPASNATNISTNVSMDMRIGQISLSPLLGSDPAISVSLSENSRIEVKSKDGAINKIFDVK